ncbi:ABC transporter ATP-binding protein [Limoniibacter endophyticus]|uniref:Sugar ABC transporter ATP-binding protein n=1 Tax=Limoniibacter endophyticus TaxID=1565040 RepID=A0A8J3DI94_9HYPH|nr:sn-glycerol-3-phosphate ABC transporter ATP-binding protein UgpC [Limoniibacter endophyticus]GHC70588.1 sugar ABC transporter ATP-binding protein [Limoniibacter endophyticus]
MSFLKIENLNKSFGDTQVLKGIDLEIEEGGFLVLVGPSGCGKSTLLNTIAGLENITSGKISIGGRVVNDLHPSERDIAMVFQSYALYPNMTVRQNVAFGMEIRKVPKPERERAIQSVAETLQIAHLLDRKPSQLSGGQRQRVAMGRALVRDPQVFLFDEPLSNLDAKLRVDMRTEIKRLHQKMGTTIVYVTHDQIEAMTLATRIAVLRDGLLQQFGTPTEIYNRPANIFVADFMGSPSMNLIPAKLKKNGTALAIEIATGDASVTLPLSGENGALNSHAGQEVIFGVRPEALFEIGEAEAHKGQTARFIAPIEVVEPAGADTFAVTHLGGKAVVARLGADTGITPGTTAELAVNLDKAVFFDPKTEQRIG